MAEEPLESSSSNTTTSSRLSPAASERTSTDGSLPAGISPDESPNTPSRKNKRKSSEPRRRSDFSVKRFCPDPNTVADLEGEHTLREFPPDTPETATSGSTPDLEEKQGTVRGTTPLQTEIGWFSIPIQSPKITMPANKKGSQKANNSHRKSQSGAHTPILQTMAPAVLQPAHNTPVLMAQVDPRASPSSTSSNPSFSQHGEEDDSLTFMDPLTGRPTKRSRKNYKNMTRERRVEANARERSRVHTISAAFESLRRAVPSYSYNQKLSKLAILRIACSYIMSLSKLADVDLCQKANNLSFIECVDLCTQTIQTEGRARRRH